MDSERLVRKERIKRENDKMLYTGIYFAILLLLTFFCIVKKANVLGTILFALYTGSALFALIAVGQGNISTNGVQLFPYFFLAGSLTIFFYPFYRNKTVFNAGMLNKEIHRNYILFAYFYIICAVISVWCYIPSVKALLGSGSWYLNRSLVYADKVTYPYRNTIEHFAMLFSSYTEVLALIVGFSIFRMKKNTKTGVLLVALTIARTTCSAIYTSSRGMIIQLAILVLAIYCFFYKDIEENKRRFVTVLIIIAILVITPYIIDVTVSRFSGTRGAGNSVIQYLGQPPIVFNRGVFTSEKIAWGNYGFGALIGSSFSPEDIGGTWGTGFFTFVGWIFIDWGILGVVLIGVICAFFFSGIIKKQEYQISDLFLLFTYYYTLAKGVFVIGREYCYILIASLVIYALLKFVAEKYVFTIRDYRI